MTPEQRAATLMAYYMRSHGRAYSETALEREIAAAIRDAVAAERAACAALAEVVAAKILDNDAPMLRAHPARMVAAAIRARGALTEAG